MIINSTKSIETAIKQFTKLEDIPDIIKIQTPQGLVEVEKIGMGMSNGIKSIAYMGKGIESLRFEYEENGDLINVTYVTFNMGNVLKTDGAIK